MGAIMQTRRGRSQQRPHVRSPIDWSSLFARDLALSIKPGIERGYDPVSGRLPTAAGIKPTPSLTGLAGGFGATYGTSATADRITTALATPFPVAGRTVEAEFIRNGVGGGNLGRLFDKTNGGSGQFLNWWSSVASIVYSFYAGGAEQSISIPGTSATGVLLRVRVTHEYANGVSIINAWVNGIQTVFGTTINGTLNDAPSTPMTIGNRAADLARGWDGLIVYLIAWNRITPAEEVVVFDPAALERTSEPMLGDGSKGAVADTALTGSAVQRVTITGALSTSIRLGGAALATSSAGAALSSSIRLAGAAQVSASGAAALSSAIRLAGAIVVQSSASGQLQGAAVALSGGAYAQASAAGALATSIRLGGLAASSVTATGALSFAQGPIESIDVTRISPARIVVFEGSGSRVTPFDSSGSRVTPFDSSGSRVTPFEGSGSKTVRFE